MGKRRPASPPCALTKVSTLAIFCCSRRVPILPQQTSVDLSPVLADVGAELMVRTLAGLEQGTSAARQAGSCARRRWRRFCSGKTAASIGVGPRKQIYDRWRGFQPWPGAFTNFRGKKLILHAMHVGRGFAWVCARLRERCVEREIDCWSRAGKDTWLDLLELQMEGKRRMPVDSVPEWTFAR